MPILRYFAFIGSLLLAFLFVADRYLAPEPDAISSPPIDKTVIRIHSARALPDKIVFDTSRPTIAPPPVSTALADAHAEDALREAHAMFAAPQVQAEKPAQAEKPVPPKRRVAERRIRQHRVARESGAREFGARDVGVGNFGSRDFSGRDPRFAFNQRNLFAGW